MLTIEDLSDSLGLSEYQVRRRIKALDDLISDHTKRGNNSKIMVDSGGLEMLKRLKALRKEGLTIDEAVEEIRSETQVKDNEVSANQHKTSVESELLRERINHLERENNYLRKKLDQKEDQIQQLLPAAQEKEKPEASPWELFKNWLFKPR